jgi:hypothetical protein
MFWRLARFFLILCLALFAFLFATHIFMKDAHDSEAFVSSAFFTQLQRSFGDIDFSDPSETSTGTTMIVLMVFYFMFAFFMVILMMNLMVAIMSEAIVEVSANAKARWCQNQHTMLQRLREDKAELLPWFLLRVVRYWYNSMDSIIANYWRCCCCCCKGLRQGEVWYAVDMRWDPWKKDKDGRSAWACKVHKLRAKIAFDSLEYNHMRLQYNYGDRLAAKMSEEIKKTIDLWMAVDKQFHPRSLPHDDNEKKSNNDVSQRGSEKAKIGEIPERFCAIMNDGINLSGWNKFVEDCNTRYRSDDENNDDKFWPRVREQEEIDNFDQTHPIRGLTPSRQDSRGTSKFCNLFSSRLRVSLIWSKFQEDDERREKAKQVEHQTCGCTHANADPLFVPAGGLFHVSGFQSFHLLYHLSKKARACVSQLREKMNNEANRTEVDQIYPETKDDGQVLKTIEKECSQGARITFEWNTIKKECFEQAIYDLFT